MRHFRFFDHLRQSKKQLGAKLNTLLYCMFPVLVIILLYQYPEKASGNAVFRIEPPEIIMFTVSVLLLTILFSLLSTIFKKPWIASAVIGFLCYILAVADISKYQKLGARITVDDLLMVPDIGKLWSFTKKGSGGLEFSMFYLVAALLLIFCAFLLWFYQVSLPRFMRLGRLGRITLTFMLGISFLIKDVAKQVFMPQIEAFDVVCSYSDEKVNLSSIDCLIGSLYSDTKPPDTTLPYDEKTVSGILKGYPSTQTNSIRPDVVVILSESYFDLNQVKGISLSEDLYRNFRRMKTEGTGGEIVVPAFGGGTSATEYEVLSGTPNKGLSNSKAPYRGVKKDSTLWTYQSYFKDLGYHSTYIHPFKSSFYNREDAFTAMGFDDLIFEDSLTVPVEDYLRDKHISDRTLFHQIEKTLDDGSGGRPQLIFSASMQNHSPYVTISEDDRDIVALSEPNADVTEEDLDAMNAYANGVADTDLALGEFLDYIDHRDRPTVLVFYGDHHPLLEGYNKLNGISSDQTYDNLDTISTPFAIYSNYASKLPQAKCSADNGRISAFYLMDVLINYLDLPKTSFTSFLDDAMTHLPIVSMKISIGDEDDPLKPEYEDKLLLLAYDRLLGGQFSLQMAFSKKRRSKYGLIFTRLLNKVFT